MKKREREGNGNIKACMELVFCLLFFFFFFKEVKKEEMGQLSG